MKFILLIASVTLSSHTLGIEKRHTPCHQTQSQPQQSVRHRGSQTLPNRAKWVPREAPW